MAHPVSVLQSFFQKTAQVQGHQIAYDFTDYCTDLPNPEKRFVCTVKTPRFVAQRTSNFIQCHRTMYGELFLQAQRC